MTNVNVTPGSRVHLYRRVSTEEQAKGGVSLEAQEARCREWARFYGIVIVDVITDEGVSAKSLDRPGVKRVLADLDSGAVDGVLVMNLLRLTRSSADWAWLMGRYFGPGVKPKHQRQLLSVDDLVDTRTPIGRFVLTVRIAAAQLDRENTADTTARILRHVQSKGVHLGSRPFGYKRAHCGNVDPEHRCNVCGTLEPLPEEQAELGHMRALRAGGDAYETIAEALNAKGVTGSRGGAWTATAVRRVLMAKPVVARAA
jgi:site-specific DNA recombinase